MSAELFRKADTHLCVALNRKVRISYTLLLYSYVELLCAQFPNLRFLILPFT
mgnify:CR=1 FL=1